MLRISLGSLGDEYMPCSSTHIHLLLTIISLQLSASLFFLYSVLKVHPAAGMSRSSVTFLPTALSRSYRLASLWLFGTLVPRRLPLLSLCFSLSTSAGVLCSQTIPFVRVLPPAQLVVGSSGLEPPTSRLSGVRSNHLSYEPIFRGRLRFAFPAYLFVLPALLHVLPRDITVPSHSLSFATYRGASRWWR